LLVARATRGLEKEAGRFTIYALDCWIDSETRCHGIEKSWQFVLPPSQRYKLVWWRAVTSS